MMQPLIKKLVSLGPCGVGTLHLTNHCSGGGVVNKSVSWVWDNSSVQGPQKQDHAMRLDILRVWIVTTWYSEHVQGVKNTPH